MAEKHTPKDEETQTEVESLTPAADEHAYFFPNSGEDAPFSCSSKSLEAAEKLDDQYLKDQKKEQA